MTTAERNWLGEIADYIGIMGVERAFLRDAMQHLDADLVELRAREIARNGIKVLELWERLKGEKG